MDQAEQRDRQQPVGSEPPEEAEAGAEGASCDNCGGGGLLPRGRRQAMPVVRPPRARRQRRLLPPRPRAAGAVFRRASAGGLFLCSDCDFGRHCGAGEPTLHDRCAVQPYTGCPPASELAALLGVPLFDKPDGTDGDGWWNIWEEPQVLSLEDLIVPTTPCHGFQPLLRPSSPKNRSISLDAKMNQEILRQLGELAEADGGVQAPAPAPAVQDEAERTGDQFPSWAPPLQYNFGTENNHEVATMPIPVFENGSWNNSDYQDLSGACKVELSYEQTPLSSAEACLSSFVQMSEICPSMSNGSSMEDSQKANAGIGVPVQGVPKKGGFDVVPCPDRGSVISRYKEKRKTRRFDKQVRYESRKVRADGRLRIKGRFAKAKQI